MRKRILLGLFLALVPAGAATLTINNAALAGNPDSIVGWGFTIESTPIDDGGNTIIPWLLITGEDVFPDSGFSPVGVFNAFLVNPPDLNMAIGPDAGNGELNPWTQGFDNFAMTGLGSYHINDFQSPGDQTVGTIVLVYDMYRHSPNSLGFDPSVDQIAINQTMSAAVSVTVTSPEPGTAILLGIAIVCWLARRRTRAAVCVLVALSALGARAAHRIEPAGDEFVTANAAEQLTVRFHDGRADFTHPAGRFSLSLAGVPAASRAEARGNRVEFTRGNVTEWFVNGDDGIEQGFTIAAKPAGGPIEIALDVAGDFEPAIERTSVLLRRNGRTILRYAALHSWDADGRPLPSRAEIVGRRIRLLVDDSTARYPVTVDPVVQEAKLDMLGLNTSQHPIAVSGDVAVIGYPHGAGVYSRSGGAWSPVTQLTVDNPGEITGVSVAAGPGIVVLGSAQDGPNGAVYVFTGSGNTWGLDIKLTVPMGLTRQSGRFGNSIALSGNTLLVGAPSQFGTGAAFVYVRQKSGWTDPLELVPGNAEQGDNVGASVALSGDTAVIGAPTRHTTGAVFVYHRAGSTWSQERCSCSSGLSLELTAAGAHGFGSSVAVDGDTSVVGANYTGILLKPLSTSAYVFGRSTGIWTLGTMLVPLGPAPEEYAAAVAVSGDVAVVTAKGLPGSGGIPDTPGTAFLFARAGGNWFSQAEIDGSVVGFGGDAAMQGDTLVLGSYKDSAAFVYRITNVTLTSSPPGRGFTLSGAGCGNTGAFATPYSGLWTDCAVQWLSPDSATQGTRYTFQRWGDNSLQNPRSFILSGGANQTYNATFLTEYQLSTLAVPVTGGTVAGSGWYAAGTNAAVIAIPNPGFLFTGFGGALSGFTNARTILMDAPKGVTGGFSPTPPAVLNGAITAKSGTAASRQWTITLTDAGPGTAYNAQVFLITFVQTFGAPCATLPVPHAPVALPVAVGTLAPGTGAQLPVVFDFTGCPTNARFTVNIGYMSNGGWSGGVIQLVNQLL